MKKVFPQTFKWLFIERKITNAHIENTYATPMKMNAGFKNELNQIKQALYK